MNNTPKDVIRYEILKFLSAKDLARVACTTKLMNECAKAAVRVNAKPLLKRIQVFTSNSMHARWQDYHDARDGGGPQEKASMVDLFTDSLSQAQPHLTFLNAMQTYYEDFLEAMQKSMVECDIEFVNRPIKRRRIENPQQLFRLTRPRYLWCSGF